VRGSKRAVAGLFGQVAANYDQAGFLHEIARRLVSQAGVLLGDRVLDVACGAGAAALEATGSFDVVRCASAVYLLRDQRTAVRRWRELLRPGGRLALEKMDDRARAAYRVAAFAAIEACREADGALHWRPEVAFAVAPSQPVASCELPARLLELDQPSGRSLDLQPDPWRAGRPGMATGPRFARGIGP
jgi:protein-L-isoaspartate O-methyltransferase